MRWVRWVFEVPIYKVLCTFILMKNWVPEGGFNDVLYFLLGRLAGWLAIRSDLIGNAQHSIISKHKYL